MNKKPIEAVCVLTTGMLKGYIVFKEDLKKRIGCGVIGYSKNC